jgi:hypothetical protein
MKLDKENLLKHHFWIGLGVVVPLLLAALCLLWFSVSKDITSKQGEVTKAREDLEKITSGTPKNARWLAAYEQEKTKWVSKRDEVHAKAWEAQNDLMTWPGRLNQVYRHRYFGDPIDNFDRSDYADQLYQTQFAELYWLPGPKNWKKDPRTGSGEVVVQYGTDFWNLIQPSGWSGGVVPTSEEMWLAQEDIWVRREMLRVIKQANELVGIFKEVKAENGKDAQPTPKDEAAPAAGGETVVSHKRIRNPYWEIELICAQKQQGSAPRMLRGTITNIGKRQQPLGITFQVRVQGRSDGRWAPVHIDHEPLAVGKSAPIKELNLEPYSPDRECIHGVEQVFNWRTVPIKRIDLLALSYPSHRNAARTLMQPDFPSLKKDETALVDETGMGMDAGMGMGGMGGPEGGMMPGMQPGMMGGMGPGGMGPGGMGMGGMGGMGMGMLGSQRLYRYIDRTPQVRRMPIGMVVVADQNHIQDFLTAFANSRLRIQTTQVHWQHFRGSIKPMNTDYLMGTGVAGGMGLAGDPERPAGMMGRGGVGPAGTGSPDGMAGVGPTGVGGMGPGGMGAGRMQPGMMAGGLGGRGAPGYEMYRGMNLGSTAPGMPDYSGMPGYGDVYGTGMMTQLDGEYDAPTLVELVVYGIASLYERYPPKPPAPEAPAETTTETTTGS